MKRAICVIILALLAPTVLFLTACKTQAVSDDRTTVHIYYMNGQQPDTVMVKTKEKLNISNPTSNYFDFVGWYEDKEYTIPFDINKKVGDTAAIYAKWEMKSGLTETQKVAADIQKLVMLAENVDYSGGRAQVATAQYIRSDRYSSGQWNILCGAVPEAFENIIEQKKPELSYLKSLDHINFGDIEIDFVHFAATLNAVLRSGENSGVANLCGYIGDLAQVVVSVPSGPSQVIYINAKNAIGAQSGVFSASDFWADLFAVVVGTKAKENNVSFAEILCEYLNKSQQEIVNIFLNICFENIEQQEIASKVQSRLNGMLVEQWIERNGGANELQKSNCAQAFADYLLSFVQE